MTSPDAAVQSADLTVVTTDPVAQLEALLPGGDGLSWTWRGTPRSLDLDVESDGTVSLRADHIPLGAVAVFLTALASLAASLPPLG